MAKGCWVTLFVSAPAHMPDGSDNIFIEKVTDGEGLKVEWEFIECEDDEEEQKGGCSDGAVELVRWGSG